IGKRETPGRRKEYLPASQDFHGKLSQAFLTDVHGLAALGASYLAFGGEGGENHVFERLAIAQGKPRALQRHNLGHVGGGGLGGCSKTAVAVRAIQFDLHGHPPIPQKGTDRAAGSVGAAIRDQRSARSDVDYVPREVQAQYQFLERQADFLIFRSYPSLA